MHVKWSCSSLNVLTFVEYIVYRNMITMKPVYNDHLYDKIYHLLFIQ